MLRTQPGEKRGSGGGKPLGAPPPWVQPKFGNYTDPKSSQHCWSCRNAPGEVNPPGTAPRRAPLHPQPTSTGSLSQRPPRGFSFPLQALSSPRQPRFASLPQLLLRSQPQLLLFDTSPLTTCTGSGGGGREPPAASPVGWEPPSSRFSGPGPTGQTSPREVPITGRKPNFLGWLRPGRWRSERAAAGRGSLRVHGPMGTPPAPTGTPMAPG